MTAPLAAQTPAIDHQAVACVVAETFPRLEARVAPPETVAAARVLFQSDVAKDWYAVEMKREGPSFVGILPRPTKSLKAFRYYVEVTDKAMATARTPDQTAAVVGTAADCKGKLVAGALASASVLLHVPAGAAAIPAGFASAGVAAAGGSVSGAAAGAAAGGTGGGMSTGTLVGIVAAAGAAAAGVVAVASKSGGATTYTGPVTGQWTIASTVTGTSPGQQSSTCHFTNTFMLSFSGSLSGGVVTGTLSFGMSGQGTGTNPGGSFTQQYSGSTTIPVTLR